MVKTEWQEVGSKGRGRGRGRGNFLEGRGRGRGSVNVSSGRLPNRQPRNDRGNWRSEGRGRGGSGGRGGNRSQPPVRPRKADLEEAESREEVRVEVEDLICHAFLPKKLPDNIQEHLVEVEEQLLENVITGIADCIKDGFSHLEPSKRMMDLWKQVQPKWRSDDDEDHFANSVKQILNDQNKENATIIPIPVYVRKQNCMLIMHKLDQEFMQITTFRATLRSQTVMSSVGSLSMTFPETCDAVYNKELLASNVFLYQLHELSVDSFENSLPKIKKGEAYHTDPRDVADPFLVTDWIIGCLCPASYTFADDDKPLFGRVPFQKKIRDQVNCEMSARAVPFRRSGMWTSIKVTLQMKLLEDFGNVSAARLVYKLVMLRVLTGICQQYVKCVSISLDSASQLLAKLARRVGKLEEMPLSADNEFKEEILAFKEKCLEFCHLVVSSFQNEINSLWRRDTGNHSIIKKIIRSKEEFQKDVLHELQWLDQHIQQSLPMLNNFTARAKQTKMENQQRKEALTKSPDFLRSLLVKRYGTLDLLLKNQHAFNSQFSGIDDIQERIWVYDTEYYIKHLDAVDELGKDTENVQNLIVAYFRNAVPRYTIQSDPVGFSQMILVILKCLQIMDKICIGKYPLLLQYKTGVKPELLDRLLLPHQQDMKLLDQLVDYFRNRNASANHSSLVADNNYAEVGALDFPVCFVEQSEYLLEIHQKIVNNTKMAEQAKLAELRKVKAECEQLNRNLRSLGGICKSVEANDGKIHDNKKGSRNFQAITCERCRINSILKFKRRSVKRYERPLPDEDSLYLQYAVVFEVHIPPEICLLRDMLALLNFEILGMRKQESGKPPPVEEWRAYMKRQGVGEEFKSKGGSPLGSIDLVSPRIPTSGTCIAKIENPDVLTSEEESFVVNNDLGCIYFYQKPLWFPAIKNAANICTFQLGSTSPGDARIYEKLQWTVGSTEHCQNEVISKSHNHSHHKLTSHDEYVSFGSIRAHGDRIQLWNLFREIHDRALSLHKEPVLCLVLQVMWQVGPQNDNGVRQFSQDFLNTGFSLEFLTMLDELVDSCTGNYSEPLVLLLAIVSTVRILEMNTTGECRDACYLLLKKSRNVVRGWIEKIEDNLVKCCNESEAMDDSGASLDFFKSRLLEATLCTMFTYHVAADDEELQELILQSEEDYVQWFHAISRLHQLTVEESLSKSQSSFVQVLISIARNIPLKLQLEKHLKTSTKKDVMLRSLHLLTREKWPKVEDCVAGTCLWSIYNEKENPHVLFGGYEEATTGSKVKGNHFISLDLVQGTFLVNGFPQTTLPLVIRNHPLFKRFFLDSKFRIQRFGTSARTVDKFHGKHYDFELLVKTGKEKTKFDVDSLIIREIKEDWRETRNPSQALEMLEPALFRHAFGANFSENYSHWLDKAKKVVYFRRLPKQDSDYKRSHDYLLRRDDKKGVWSFFDEHRKKHLLSINSAGFAAITAALSRLETKEEINVLFDSTSGSVTAKLPRHNLSFNLVDSVLHSLEYTDFRISENQNMGTLIGLQHGLLLEIGENPDRYAKRILIMPHGFLEPCLLNLKFHHNTIIDIDSLRQPSFFVYDYDTVLRQLKADKSQAAWLYLAALHGWTSSSLQDPFTQVTGTEKCMEILQSGRAFPTQPYSIACLETLGMIRDLAPRRSYYGIKTSFLHPEKSKEMEQPKKGQTMEITQWHDIIPSIAAYDGYVLIVDNLVEKSGRLVELHDDCCPPRQKVPARKSCQTDDRDSVDESQRLYLRAYQRCLPFYNQAVVVSAEYLSNSCREVLGTGSQVESTLRDCGVKGIAEGYCLRELLYLSQTRLVNTMDKRSAEQWQKYSANLESYLISDEPIAPLAFAIVSPSSLDALKLKDLLNMKFEINWLQLYAWALNTESGASPAFTLILTALAYRAAAPLDHILHLHYIAKLAGEEHFPAIPALFATSSEGGDSQGPNEDLIIPTECEYETDVIQAILENCMIPFTASLGKEENSGEVETYLESARADAKRIADALRKYWPCPGISVSQQDVKDLFTDTNLRYEDSMAAINSKVGYWHRNLEFCSFIREVQEKLNAVLQSKIQLEGKITGWLELYKQFQFSRLAEVNLKLGLQIDGGMQIKLADMMTEADLGDKIFEEADSIFETGRWFDVGNTSIEFSEQRKLCEEKIKELLEYLSGKVCGNSEDGKENKIISLTGIAPRITPITLLQYLAPNSQTQHKSKTLMMLVGALAVLWTHLKRLNRCIALQKKGKSAASTLRKEVENTGLGNDYKTYPQWLLLELELDIMIRAKQVRSALQMMRMPNGRNGVMQLNMGEGKTSVIVPMLCAALANSEDSLVRVTVLNSIFKTNLNILIFAIGGLLNQRVYTYRINRQVKLTEDKAQTLENCLKECLKARGVILTTPDSRHSFGLLAWDKILKEEFALADKLLKIKNWLRYYCRDILDESDELLNVNNQQVYSVGKQCDGEKLRWEMCQKLLDSVKKLAGRLHALLGENIVEFDVEQEVKFPKQFATFRLLSDEDEALEGLVDLIAEDMMSGLKFEGENQRMLAKLFITEQTISEEDHNSLMASLEKDSDLQCKILLLSAYLRRDVLLVALRKRWRVEYGVNPIGNKFMAVPFRAKDVAAEKNEFAHLDLAIVLTCLSYRYSGLSDEQVRESLDFLKKDKCGQEIYDEWIRDIPLDVLPTNLHSLQSVNLADFEHCQRLFPVLKKHTSSIDYWLNRRVFPRECKQFSKKLVMTPFDLCDKRTRHPVVGFSGTNGRKQLLPMQITQQDLEELKATNEQMEQALLQPENNQNNMGFRTGVTCQEILQQMQKSSIQILIDAGALMLDCTNEQVAKLWLETDSTIEAVVYFDNDGEIMVKCRTEDEDTGNVGDIRLEESPFKYNLEKCATFLDDAHTRGTDLKFPLGSRAAVTVGSRMQRDKLVQACMRMRELGNGHSVTFYLSHEAHVKVNDSLQRIETEEVLDWVKQNTMDYIQNGLVFLAINALNYAQKLVAEDNFNYPNHLAPIKASAVRSEKRLIMFAQQCQNDEANSLIDMYGHYAKRDYLIEIIPSWFESLKTHLVALNQGCPIPVVLMTSVDEVKQELTVRCVEINEEKTVFSSLSEHAMDEQQEKEIQNIKEIEKEVEEEREVEKPGPPTYYFPDLHPNVKSVILTGEKLERKPGIVLLSEIFKGTTFWNDFLTESWSDNLYATKDFYQTIRLDGVYSSMNLYLRQIQWIAIQNDAEGTDRGIKMLVLSPFEVNEMMKYWKEEGAETSTMQLHMFCRRRFQNQDLLVNKAGLQLPQGIKEFTIPNDCNSLAPLFLASGNLYFANDEEKTAYQEFLLGNNPISKNPRQTAKEILSCRHSYLSDVSHVIRILNEL